MFCCYWVLDFMVNWGRCGNVNSSVYLFKYLKKSKLMVELLSLDY